MKLEILFDTMADGIVLKEGEVAEVADTSARTLKSFGLARDYVEPVDVVAEPEQEADPLDGFETETDADAEEVDAKPKKGKK
ncbi:MAG: hypothetical protein E6Q97_16900 [Desulfurellales bacterium]|nr:MAG: hypothetical protein E6Q97_16900 [Desulfurellales bacterium]